MALYLGIDGGGTGCRAALADDTGQVLARATAGPANIASDPSGARSTLADIARRLLSQVGAAEAASIGLGLAGANAIDAAAVLKDSLPTRSIRLACDARTATLGALGDQDGISAALGTGSVYGMQFRGDFRQIGGHGLILGDEASGAWLGRSALALALRADEGRAMRTSWLADLLDRMGGPSGAISFALSARPADFAGLVPEILAAAATDTVAEGLLCEAESEIISAISAFGMNLPVVFVGGLGPFFRARLADRLNTLDALGTPLDGAMRLARDGASKST